MDDKKPGRALFRRWIAMAGAVLMSGAILGGCGQNKDRGLEIRPASESVSSMAAESESSAPAEQSGNSAPAKESTAGTSASETGNHVQALPVQMFVDGEETAFGSLSPESTEELRVYVSLDGMVLIDLPFGEEHTIRVLQINGDENTVHITRDAVFMEESNCQNHDCVMMGEITLDNLEMRVMGGFIICLPHRLSVEVRGR